MTGYSEECLKPFLKNQGQLFAEPVAETLEEAAMVHGIDSDLLVEKINAAMAAAE